MNDDDEGFTIVDETFGVREASDCSDDGSENSPQERSPRRPVRLNITSASDLDSRPRSSRAGPAAFSGVSSDMSSASRREDATQTARVDPKRGDAPSTLNPGPQHANNNGSGSVAGSAPGDKARSEAREQMQGQAQKPQTWESAASEVVVNTGARQNKDTSGEVMPQQQQSPRLTKALTVRLLPGDCAFGAVVPRAGATAADLESELQRKLGLRQPVHLTSVQVRTADAHDVTLPNAPDGGTVTARPVDRVLVRARVSRGPALAATSPPQNTAAARSSAPSAWDQFVQLSLRSTWDMAMEVVRTELGVPAGRQVEARRLARAAAVGSPDDEAQPTSVSSLRNGDTLVLNVLEEAVPASAVSSDLGVSKRKLRGGTKPSIATATATAASTATATATATATSTASPPRLPRAASPKPQTASRDLCQARKTAVDPKAAAPKPADDRPVPFAASSGARGNPGARLSPPALAPPTTLAGTRSGRIVAPAPSAHYPAALDPDPQRGAAAGVPVLRATVPLPTPVANLEYLPTPTFRASPPRAALAKARSRPEGSAGAAPTAAEEEAITELVGMGFDRQHVVEALKECGRGESWKEAAISLLLEPQVHGVEVSGEAGAEVGMKRRKGSTEPGLAGLSSPSQCPICMSDIQQDEMFTVDCKEQHVFCVDCLYHHCSVQLLDSGLIPACPLSNLICGHELGQEEVERVFLLKTYSCDEGKGTFGGGNGAQGEQDKRALDTCRTLLTRRGLESTGALPCVSAECGNWMVPEGGGQRVRCNSCLTEFCGSCKRSPYHYAAECDDVVRLAREWSLWLTEGKAAFLRAVAAQDEEHKALLAQHEGRKREHDRAVQEAERLRLEYDNMEDWKERRCRCCPSCGRAIEKVSGCNMMLCGRDTHGGNVQNGCGVRFDWSMALPYIGDRGERKATPFTEREPQAAARSRHFIALDIPLRCDRCHRDVVGPLFRCIHCPSFVCCLECQDLACRDPRHVHHTFQVVEARDESPPAPASAASAAQGGRSGGSGGGACDMEVEDVV